MLRRRAVPGGGAATQAPAAAAAEREGTALTAESIWVVPSAKAAAEAGEGAAGGRQAAEGAQTAEEEPAPPAARPELSPWAEEALSRRRCAQLAESAGLAPSGAPLCAALADICTSGRCDAVAVVYHPSGRREPVELARPEELTGLEPEAVMTRLLALARGDDTTTRELLFGVRIPKPPEGEQGRLWLGSVWLDISALKSEAAMVGVPAAKLVKWLAAAAAPEADELPGLLYYALCLLSCGTLAGSLCFGWAACAATWSTGGTGVAPQELPLEQLRKRLDSIPAPKSSQLYQEYHDYYMAEYRQQLAQAAMMDNTNGDFWSSPAVLWAMCLAFLAAFVAVAAKLYATGHDIFWNTGWALALRRTFWLDTAGPKDESLSLAQPALASAGHRLQAAVAAVAGEPLAALGVAASAAPAQPSAGGGGAAAAAVPGQLRVLLPPPPSPPEVQVPRSPAGGEGPPPPPAEDGHGGDPASANPVTARPAGDAERRLPQLRIDYAASPQKQKLQRKMAARERDQLKGAAGSAATGPAGEAAPGEDPLMDENAVEALLRELEDIPKLSKKRRQQQPRPAPQPPHEQEPLERQDEATPLAEAAAPAPVPPPRAASTEARGGAARGKTKQRSQPVAKDALPAQPAEPEPPQQAAAAPAADKRRPKAPSKEQPAPAAAEGGAANRDVQPNAEAPAAAEPSAARGAERAAAAGASSAAAGRGAAGGTEARRRSTERAPAGAADGASAATRGAAGAADGAATAARNAAGAAEARRVCAGRGADRGAAEGVEGAAGSGRGAARAAGAPRQGGTDPRAEEASGLARSAEAAQQRAAERADTAGEVNAAAADARAALGLSAGRAAEGAAEDAGGTWDTAASRSARRRTRKACDPGAASPATPSAPAAPASLGLPERGAAAASVALGGGAGAAAAGLPGRGPAGVAAAEAADAPGVGAAAADAAGRRLAAAGACAAGPTAAAVAPAASSVAVAREVAGEATGDILEDLGLMQPDELVHWFRANGAEDWLRVRVKGAGSLADMSKEVLLGHATQLLGLAGDTERRSTAAEPLADPPEHAICFGDFDGRADDTDTPAYGGGVAEAAATQQEAYSCAPQRECARREWDPAGLGPEPPEGAVAQAPPAWAGGGGAVAAAGQQMGFVSMMPAVQLPGAQSGMFASGQRHYVPMVWMPAQYAVPPGGAAAAMGGGAALQGLQMVHAASAAAAAAGGGVALQGLQMVHAAGLPPGAAVFAAAGVAHGTAAGAPVAGAPVVDAGGAGTP